MSQPAPQSFSYHMDLNWQAFVEFNQLKKITPGLWIGLTEEEGYNFYIETSSGIVICIPKKLYADLKYFAPHLLATQPVQDVLKAINYNNLHYIYECL